MDASVANMSAAEMDLRARQGISKKYQEYFGEVTQREYSPLTSSYTEAKEKGNITEMIRHKRVGQSKALTVLSKEYSSTLSISEIQRRLPQAKELFNESKNLVERIYNSEIDVTTERIKNTVGGLQSNDRARAAAVETVDEWAKNDAIYLSAKKAYEDARLEYKALKNAKEIYIEDHKDLITEEINKARREELLASGILEEHLAELGITHVEDTPEE